MPCIHHRKTKVKSHRLSIEPKGTLETIHSEPIFYKWEKWGPERLLHKDLIDNKE